MFYLQCIMLELCVTSTFWVMMVYLKFGLLRAKFRAPLDRVLKCAFFTVKIGVESPWPKKHREMLHKGGHSILMVFNPFYVLLIFSSNFDFSGTAYCKDSKPVPLDSAHLEPYICMPLNPFWCNFPNQNQQNVKFLAICLTPA